MSQSSQRPSRDYTLMKVALEFSRRSTCSRRQVGAVIARDGRILTTGYNGAPAGMPHCLHPCDCSEGGVATQHDPSCWSLKPCTEAVHAEANAIAYAARWGIALEGAEMHTTCTPCVPCSQIIINAGIVRVVSLEHYRDLAGQDLLSAAGVRIR